MNEKLARTNFKYCEETMQLRKELEVRYLDFAERLYNISEQKMYEPNYESFDEFLEDIKTDRATASKLINIWRRFVLEFGVKKDILAGAGWSKAAEVLPFAKNKTQAVMWLMKAKNLTKAHLRDEINEARTGIPIEECEHKKIIMFSKCLGCGEIRRIYEGQK